MRSINHGLPTKYLSSYPHTMSPSDRRILINEIYNFGRPKQKRIMSKDTNGQLILKECATFLQCQKLLRNAYKIINDCHIYPVKKFTVLDDGLYIMISGKVVYAKTESAHQVDKKQQLLSGAKAGNFIQLKKNPYQPDPQLNSPYTIIIQQAYALLQAHKSNFMTLEDCHLIKIPSQTIDSMDYTQLKDERTDLCKNAYLQGQINTQKSLIFSVNTELHHTFRFHSYRFGTLIRLQCLAIIQRGVVKVENRIGTKIDQQSNKHNRQIQRYGILIPFVQYVVLSDQVSLMKIQANPTMCYWSTNLRNSRQKILDYRHKNIVFSKSVHLKRKNNDCIAKTENCQNIFSKKQESKKYKQKLQYLTNKLDKFITTSMYNCSKENSALKNQIMKQRSKKQEKTKYKTPTVLFDFTKSKTNKAMPSLKKMFQQKCFRQRKNNKTELAFENMVRKPKMQSINHFRGYSRDLRINESLGVSNCGDGEFYQIFDRIESKKRKQISHSVYQMGTRQ